MCGFTGFLCASHTPPLSQWPDLLQQMGDTIRHRGPNDSGVWYDGDSGIGLSHRRLSILDLSPAGHQPMTSASERYVIAFNGEIYNHLALRRDLEAAGHFFNWRGHSDTETLLAGFDAWGIEATVTKAIGMFAFALWDKNDRSLTLCRDRLGEKPLYYGWQGDTFLFGSTLAPFKIHPAFRADIDRNALTLMMRHDYIAAPYCIYQNLQKLPPGTLLTVSLQNRNAQPQPYWDGRQIMVDSLKQPFQGSPEDAVDALEALLKDAVLQQMAADVPLGVFLSGGIDSSTIVALMQAQSSRPVRTFTIGFNENGYNEAEYASAVARHLGTDHTELYVTARQAMDVIPDLPRLYCEPFSDSSQIPTFLVSRLARQDVTVSLSGDGGDELFGGYERYLRVSNLNKKLARYPVGLRKLLASGITALSLQQWNALLGPVRPLLPNKISAADIGNKLYQGADILAAGSPLEIYRSMISHWKHPSDLVIDSFEPATALSDGYLQTTMDGFIQQMMAADLLTYLPDDILAKVDRAAMGVSLETRVPLLDHRIVELAWRLPLDYKIRHGEGKWPLRQVLYKYVPKELMERPKMGFGIPIAAWLRGPLRDWAEALLNESRLRQEGYFNPVPIRHKWAQHMSGKYNWHYLLWDVLMFQAWLEAQKNTDRHFT